MTDLETIARAKMYIDKLANGINPLDDTAIEENDVVNNVKISRCLFFVSDTLQKVIENGGITIQKIKKAEFNITAEELEKQAEKVAVLEKENKTLKNRLNKIDEQHRKDIRIIKEEYQEQIAFLKEQLKAWQSVR